MPLSIVQGDIARVAVDAIVNSANPRPVVGRGVDAAIHGAAGRELLEARRRVGDIRVGDAVATGAGNLQAKVVVHTVGPVWQGGGHGELDALASCYARSLAVAAEHGCASIAFPLISTGTYGFPKDRALSVAKASIAAYLRDHDMDVLLVVHDRAAFQLSREVADEVGEYIGANRGEAPDAGAAPFPDGLVDLAYEASAAPESAAPGLFRSPSGRGEGRPRSLDDVLDQVGESFSERLLRMIDERGLADPEVYKRANIDRRLFSKIRGNPGYQPKKGTAVALAVALRLNLDETLDLIGRAGYTLSSASVGDLIVSFFIERENWDVNEINLVLFEYGQPLIGR